MHVAALIPVGSLEGAKSRLGPALDPEERRDLVMRLLEQTVAACHAAGSLMATFVVSPDPAALAEAQRLGATAIGQQGGGLNDGLRAARAAAQASGAGAILILPVDLPLISSDAINDVVRAAALDAGATGPIAATVVLVADRHGRGTNALYVQPADAIDPCFGGDSATAHRAQAMAAGARLINLGGPLALDIDTPDDLLLAEELAPQALRPL